MPSPPSMFAFDLPTQQNNPSESQNVAYHPQERYYTHEHSAPTSAHMIDAERTRCDPDLQSPRTFLHVDAERPHRGAKGFLTLLPTGYPTMTNPDTSPVHGGHPKTHAYPSYGQHHPQAWPSRETHAYAQEQLRSAPLTTEGNPLQAFQAHPTRMYHSAIPPSTAPLTVTTPHAHAAPYSAYDPHQPMYHPPPGPLQLQQSAYASVPSTSSAPPTGGWYHPAGPLTRPALQHVHSNPGITMRDSPVAGGPEGSNPGRFAEQQRHAAGYGVYDPAIVVDGGAASRGDGDGSAEGCDDDDDAAGETAKDLVPFNEARDRRTLRSRLSVSTKGTTPLPDAEEERPRKRSKPVRGEEGDLVAVKANGKGNQFILTLYQMVEAPSSYPLIGWNVPGKAIVIPDSKAFANEMLNKYFRHSTISSFARQLVSYGFLKTELPARERALVNGTAQKDSKHWTFSHDFFMRGRADLLDQVAPLQSPSRPTRGTAKRSLAAMKREEEAFVDVLKREVTHWRERCDRLEQCMLEEKVRANQYLAVLMERGIVPGGGGHPFTAPTGMHPPQAFHVPDRRGEAGPTEEGDELDDDAEGEEDEPSERDSGRAREPEKGEEPVSA